MDTVNSPDEWFATRTSWADEVATLRNIVRETGLTETLKWRQPCYTDQGKNIVIISTRRGGAIASFLKGALLKEAQGRFIQPGQERSGRYLSYTSVAEIEADRTYLHGLIQQAVAVERAGKRVAPLPKTIDYCDELQARLDTDSAFRTAFEALTLGRRRGYALHFAKAKKSATRVARIEKAEARIFQGKGLLDCICGHTKRPPGCDGSHKYL